MHDTFQKFYRRLAHVGIFRAAVLGLALSLVGVGVAALIAFIARASVPVIIGVTIGVGVGVFAAALPLLYFWRFRPTEAEVARRLDELGLAERAVTMYQFREDGSRMARFQREDAQLRISSVPPKRLKFSVTLPVLLLLVFGALFAAGTTTASVLAADNSPAESVVPPVIQTYTVTYRVREEGTGSVQGEAVQQVEKGGFTTPVTAVPASGYRFVGWTDQNDIPLANQNNPRSEVNVRNDLIIFACFEQSAPPATGDDSGNGSEQGDNGPSKEGDDADQQSPDDPGAGGEESKGGEGNSDSGFEANVNNNVIDGTKDYKDSFDREQLENELADRDIPDDLKDILGDYYDTLKP